MSLGEPNPDRLLRSMSAHQWAEWQAFLALEPSGPPAEFWRAGMIASTIANVNRTKKSQKVLMPDDFMPRSFQPERVEPDDQ